MRLQQIDALRGFALLGILIVNIFVFHAPYAHYGEFYGQFEGSNATILQTMLFLCGGKFMFIYAFLFGYSFWIQYDKWEDKIAFRSFWNRRMVLLMGFGILHVLLLSFGDILLPYALLGLLLPFIVKWSNRKLILLTVLIYSIPLYEFVLRGFLTYPSIFTHSQKPLSTYLTINAEGNFLEIFKLRMYDYFSFKNEKLIMYIPKEFSLFLVGILAAKSKMANNIDLRKGGLFCLIAIIVIGTISLYNNQILSFFDYENSILQRTITGIIITGSEFLHGMLYIVGFFLIWKINAVQKLLAFLKYAGRLSLTNYIGQSLICAILFLGFGMYGTLNPQQLIILAFIIYFIQAVFSYFWLQYRKQGPLESLWRKYSRKNGA